MIINLTLDNLKYFIINGKFENGLDTGISKDDVIKIFGIPPNFAPQKRKNKAIMNYGALNIYLYSSVVTSFSINSTFNYLNNLNMETIRKETIIKYLKYKSICINDTPYVLDDDNTKFIIINDIHLGFLQNKLFYISKGM